MPHTKATLIRVLFWFRGKMAGALAPPSVSAHTEQLPGNYVGLVHI